MVGCYRRTARWAKASAISQPMLWATLVTIADFPDSDGFGCSGEAHALLRKVRAQIKGEDAVEHSVGQHSR